MRFFYSKLLPKGRNEPLCASQSQRKKNKQAIREPLCVFSACNSLTYLQRRRREQKKNGLTLPFFYFRYANQVFRAIDSLTGAVVAVKRLPLTTAGSAAALAREVGLLSALSHRHVVRCAAAFAARGHLALVLEHCDGGCLRDALDAGAFFTAGNALNYAAILDTAADVAKALLHLHRHRVVHADLKVRNILLKSDATSARGFVAKGECLCVCAFV